MKEKKKCKISPFYSRDELDILHFHCDFCNKEMFYDDNNVRICGNQNREKCSKCGKELGNADYFAGMCLDCEQKIQDDEPKKKKRIIHKLTIDKLK